MRPRKAPAYIDRALREICHYGYGDGFYQTFVKHSPLQRSINFSQHDPGWLVNLGVHYPVGENAIQANPPELSVLLPDRTLSDTPSLYSANAFWHLEQEQLMCFEGECLEAIFQILEDPDVMIPYYTFLLGESGFDSSAIPFSISSAVRVKKTDNRLLGKACYLALAGHFDLSVSTLKKINPVFIGGDEEKIISDCIKRKIDVPQSSIDYLLSIGASV